jgi:hypothetical protein
MIFALLKDPRIFSYIIMSECERARIELDLPYW